MLLFNSILVRGLAVAALLVVASAEHLSAQRLRGRTLRSPGRGIGVRSAPVNPPPPPPPAFVDSAVVRSAGAPVESPVVGGRRYELRLTPSVEGDNESTAYGAQILVERGRVSAGLSGQMIHADATDQLNPAVQGDVELMLVDEGRGLGLPISLIAVGAISVTRREGNEAVGSAVADMILVGDGEERFSVSLQGLGNYGVSWALGGESRSGPYFGVGTSLVLAQGLGVEAEYDFDSSYGEEDTWQARVVLDLPARGFRPALAVGAGKHGTFQVSLQLTR
jgi:hypothetical protein